MTADIGAADDLRMDTLADALGVGLELLDLFAHDGECCAIWLGGDDGTTRDFVVCADDDTPDPDRLVRHAMVGAALIDDVSQAVLWRTVDDVSDGWQLTDDFFDHPTDRYRHRRAAEWIDRLPFDALPPAASRLHRQQQTLSRRTDPALAELAAR